MTTELRKPFVFEAVIDPRRPAQGIAADNRFAADSCRSRGRRADYPGVAADLDLEKIASILPAMKKQALAMWAEGERLTGHPGLPLDPTPNLAAAE